MKRILVLGAVLATSFSANAASNLELINAEIRYFAGQLDQCCKNVEADENRPTQFCKDAIERIRSLKISLAGEGLEIGATLALLDALFFVGRYQEGPTFEELRESLRTDIFESIYNSESKNAIHVSDFDLCKTIIIGLECVVSARQGNVSEGSILYCKQGNSSVFANFLQALYNNLSVEIGSVSLRTGCLIDDQFFRLLGKNYCYAYGTPLFSIFINANIGNIPDSYTKKFLTEFLAEVRRQYICLLRDNPTKMYELGWLNKSIEEFSLILQPQVADLA